MPFWAETCWLLLLYHYYAPEVCFPVNPYKETGQSPVERVVCNLPLFPEWSLRLGIQ